MLSLGSPKINFQYDNPHGFDQLIEAIEKYVTKEDVDEERRSESSTPGGSDKKQLAFQVLSCQYHFLLLAGCGL